MARDTKSIYISILFKLLQSHFPMNFWIRVTPSRCDATIVESGQHER